MEDSEKIKEIQEACKNSLYFLCKGVLGYKDWDAIHDELEIFLARKSSKKALLLPRGHLKTSIVTVGCAIKEILNKPNTRILIANQIWDKARDMLSEIKEQLDTKSQLPLIFGQFKSDKWNMDSIVVRQRTRALKEPTIATTGVEAETTGGHYDFIILDDLMGLQNCQTPEQREKVKRFRRSMIDLLEPNGKLIEVGTRWHLDDTFSEVFEKEKDYYDVMVRQVVEKGKCIFPKKFNMKFDSVLKNFVPVEETTMDFIEHLKKIHTIAEFNSQYLNNPIDEENQIFKNEYFKYFDKRPENLYVAMTVDLAISQKQSADYTAIIVGGMDKEYNIYILDYIRGRWTPHEIVNNIFQMQSKWKPYACGMETNGFQKTLKFSVEDAMRDSGHYFPFEEIKTGNQVSKEYRIKSLEPAYRCGSVYHHTTMKGKELEEELTTFPSGKHDDLIDAESMLLNLLGPGVSEQQREMQPGTWEYIEREAHKYMDNSKGFFNY